MGAGRSHERRDGETCHGSFAMEPIERIHRIGRRLRTACTVLIWLLTLATTLYWMGFNYFPDFSREALRSQLPVNVGDTLPFWALLLGYVLTLMQLSIVIYGLAQLRRLFGLYEKGRIFEHENVACLRKVSLAVIVWAATKTVFGALVGIAVTLPNPPGQRMLTLGVDSDQVLALFAGFALLTISWVMEEGRKVQAEQSLIV